MKISKKDIKAATAIENNNVYAACIEHIREAIDCLADCAKDDPLARDAIADLSVVLFELQ